MKVSSQLRIYYVTESYMFRSQYIVIRLIVKIPYYK